MLLFGLIPTITLELSLILTTTLWGKYVLTSFSEMGILSLREVRCMSRSLSWWVEGLGFELTSL